MTFGNSGLSHDQIQTGIAPPSLWPKVETIGDNYKKPESELAGLPAAYPVLKFLADFGIVSAIYGTAVFTPVRHKNGKEGVVLGELFRGANTNDAKLGDIPVDVVIGNPESFAIIAAKESYEGAFSNVGRRQLGNHDQEYVGALVTNEQTIYLTAETFEQITGFDRKSLPQISRPAKFSPETEEEKEAEIERIREFVKTAQPDDPIVKLLGWRLDDHSIENWVKGIQIFPGKDRQEFSINEAVGDGNGAGPVEDGSASIDDDGPKEGHALTKAIETGLRDLNPGETLTISGDATIDPDVLAPEGTPTFEITKHENYMNIPGMNYHYVIRRSDGRLFELDQFHPYANFWHDATTTGIAVYGGRSVIIDGIPTYLPQSERETAFQYQVAINANTSEEFEIAIFKLHPKDLTRDQMDTLSAHFQRLHDADIANNESFVGNRRLSFLAWQAGRHRMDDAHAAITNGNFDWIDYDAVSGLSAVLNGIGEQVKYFGTTPELITYITEIRSIITNADGLLNPFDETVLSDLQSPEQISQSILQAQAGVERQFELISKIDTIVHVLFSANLGEKADDVIDQLTAHRDKPLNELLLPVFENARQVKADNTDGIPMGGMSVEKKALELYPVMPSNFRTAMDGKLELDIEENALYEQWEFHRTGGDLTFTTDATDRMALFLHFFARHFPEDEAVISLGQGEPFKISNDTSLFDLILEMRKRGIEAEWGDDGQDPDDPDYVPPQE